MNASVTGLAAIDDCWNRIGVWGAITPRCPKLEAVVHCRNCDVYRAAARKLHDRPLPQGYEEVWRRHVAEAPRQEETHGRRSVLVFRVAGEWLALRAHCIEEIIAPVPVRSLPHVTSDLIRGIANVHGRLRVCISLAALLAIGGASGPERQSRSIFPRMVVMQRDGKEFVFAADEVVGTHRCAPGELLDVPATLSRALARFSEGIVRVGGRTVGMLDDALLFYALEKRLP